MNLADTHPCVSLHARIADIDAANWDALLPDDNPFVTHAFLSALERDGCIHPEWGWRPHHLALHMDGQLRAVAPTYLKTNSHGEYVFDWSWADAWRRAGGRYYPKLLTAVPYSPVTGPRLLAGRGADAPALRLQLVAAMRMAAERLGLSSIHANFLGADDAAAFDQDPAPHPWLARGDVQFQWHNAGYADFDGFLATLAHKKRRNIVHERRDVAESGLIIEWRDGASLSDAEWRQVHALYQHTFDTKGNDATLSAGFFRDIARNGPGVQLALARVDGDIVAMAMFLRSRDVLYGRYWGTRVEQSGLHFELCYYQGIAYAIREGIARFEPGAQGEHKLARGFLPARTHSRHYLADPNFHAAVAEALVREARAVDAYAAELRAHSPYARHAGGPA